METKTELKEKLVLDVYELAFEILLPSCGKMEPCSYKVFPFIAIRFTVFILALNTDELDRLNLIANSYLYIQQP